MNSINSLCTGYNNIILIDEEGVLFNQKGVVISNPKEFLGQEDLINCKKINDDDSNIAWFCNKITFNLMVVEVLDN